MTRHTQHLTSVAAIAVAALALSACNSTGDPGSNTTSDAATTTMSAPATTDASPTTTTPTATPTKSPEDKAIEAAEEIIPLYFEVGDRSIQDPNKFDREELKKVAISSAVDDMQNRVSAFQRQELKASGKTEVESMTNPRVDLKLDLKKSPPDVPSVQLDVCIDVSKLNVVDKDGKSMIPADRKPRQLWRVGVANYEYPKADAWRVAYTDTQGGKTC
jgi:hypothetical protein